MSQEETNCYDCVGRRNGIIILSVLGVAAFFIAILVGVSYHGLQHNELGFDKSTLRNDVDTGEVYYRGMHFLGVSHEFIIFPSTFQSVDFSGNSRLSVASKNGLEFGLNCNFQYRIKQESLADIFESFSTNYHSQVLVRATAAIKETTPLYETGDFFGKRAEVQDALWIAVRDDLAEIGMEVPAHKFQLGHPDFSGQIDAQNLAAAVQIQSNIKEQINQEAILTSEETAQLVALINANATLVGQQAVAIVDSLTVQAHAEAGQIAENAKTAGLAVIFSRFDVQNKGTFLKFIAISNGHNVKILDNVETLVKTSSIV